MEQLDYLLGYAGVFLWAFGICQVKATRDKKRWLLSGILGIGAISMIFLYPKIYALYWLALLLIFLLLFIDSFTYDVGHVVKNMTKTVFCYLRPIH